MLNGRDRTRRSLMISITAVMEVSRKVLYSADVPAHASQLENSVSQQFNQVGSMVSTHKGGPQW